MSISTEQVIAEYNALGTAIGLFVDSGGYRAFVENLGGAIPPEFDGRVSSDLDAAIERAVANRGVVIEPLSAMPPCDCGNPSCRSGMAKYTSYGIYNPRRKTIYLRDEMKPMQRTAVLIHEFAHAVADDFGFNGIPTEGAEFLAEAAEYVVLKHYGHDLGMRQLATLASLGSDVVEGGAPRWFPELVCLVVQEVIEEIDNALAP